MEETATRISCDKCKKILVDYGGTNIPNEPWLTFAFKDGTPIHLCKECTGKMGRWLVAPDETTTFMCKQCPTPCYLDVQEKPIEPPRACPYSRDVYVKWRAL